MLGGVEDPDSDIAADDGETFFYQKFYQPELGRFEDPPAWRLESQLDECVCCRWKQDEFDREKVALGEELQVSGKNILCHVCKLPKMPFSRPRSPTYYTGLS